MERLKRARSSNTNPGESVGARAIKTLRPNASSQCEINLHPLAAAFHSRYEPQVVASYDRVSLCLWVIIEVAPLNSQPGGIALQQIPRWLPTARIEEEQVYESGGTLARSDGANPGKGTHAQGSST